MNALLKFVLRGSAIGALSLVAVGAGCSSDDDGGTEPGAAGEDSGGSSSAGKSGGGSSNGGTESDAGETGSGGDKPNGGSGGSGGSGGTNSVGGDNAGGDNVGFAGTPPVIGPGAEGGSPAFGAGGETSTGTGPSVAKFCNTLSFGDDDTTLVLAIGEGADKVTFTAKTGACAPADGQECKEIAQGDEVQLALFDSQDLNTPLDVKVAPVGAGEDWVFWTDIEEVGDENFPIVTGTTIKQSIARCDEIVYSDIP